MLSNQQKCKIPKNSDYLLCMCGCKEKVVMALQKCKLRASVNILNSYFHLLNLHYNKEILRCN